MVFDTVFWLSYLLSNWTKLKGKINDTRTENNLVTRDTSETA